MKIGFLNNQIDNRGTGNAVFNYAHYNEVILGNNSKILTFPNANHDKDAVDKYINRFEHVYSVLDQYNLKDLDVLYHIKSGEDDGFRPPNGVKYAVHAVFHPQLHGDKFAVISQWMADRDHFSFVPHIVELPDTHVNFRGALGIPENATVFGRHGGFDSFDIPWVWNSIDEILKYRDDVYFLFVNTQPGGDIPHERVLYFPATVDDRAKRAFINTCDAMLHARSRGETFGIAVGEFAILGKPIFTYGGSYEKAHIFELRGTAHTYNDEDDLTAQLMAFNRNGQNHPFYDHFTPKNVMHKFEEVFLSD